jgi:hypothetical protein
MSARRPPALTLLACAVADAALLGCGASEAPSFAPQVGAEARPPARGEDVSSEAPAAEASAPEAPARGCVSGGIVSHAYFESLVARPDSVVSYAMRSQAELDALPTGAISENKLPVTYDPVIDATLVRIFAPVSTDSQQKIFSLPVGPGSMLLTWDFRFDARFAWVTQGNMTRHKTWRLDPGPWLALKTDYIAAAHEGHFAELFMTSPNGQWLGPGTTRGDREIVYPRLAPFYIEPDTWTRVWLFVRDLEKPVRYVSLWAADECRAPVQLYDELALTPPPQDSGAFRLEYDTSADQATNPEEAHSWNRNLVVLHDVPLAAVKALVQPM